MIAKLEDDLAILDSQTDAAAGSKNFQNNINEIQNA